MTETATYRVTLEGDDPQAFEAYLESLYDDCEGSITVERTDD